MQSALTERLLDVRLPRKKKSCNSQGVHLFLESTKPSLQLNMCLYDYLFEVWLLHYTITSLRQYNILANIQDCEVTLPGFKSLLCRLLAV